MEITRLTAVSADTVQTINSLLLQLNPDCQEITSERLSDIISSANAYVFVAQEGDSIIGMLTLLICELTSGTRAQIEDVVVDKKHRGKKIGEKLVKQAVVQALQLGITKIDLTSSPSRIEANALYQKSGFMKRETNVYRLDI